MTMTRIFSASAALLLGAGVALAQPAATDLGTITIGTPVQVTGIAIGPAQIVWYTITVPNVGGAIYLDIDSEGSLLATSNDTEIGLYRADGTLVASDDDDGSGLLSQLSFGAGFPTRPAVGTGVAYDGRDGSLAAGQYYLSISGFNSTFNATNWNVTSTSANVGTGVLNLNLGQVVVPPGSYVENPDAGDLPATAQQVTGGSGTVNGIRGAVTGTDADMYEIEICDAANFSATTVNGTTADTQLFLFNTSGVGVVHNDDTSAVTPIVRQSTITNASIPGNGRYYLAVTGYNRDPVDGSAALLWVNTPFDGQRLPDGPGAANPVAAWTGTGVAFSYTIALTGVCYINNAPPCVGDITGDRAIDLTDLANLLVNFGLGSGATLSQGDIDGDGDVDLIDLANLLTNFGLTCP